MYYYLISGLTVASEIKLRGVITASAQRDPQVTIRFGSVPERLPDARYSSPNLQVAGNSLLLRSPNVAHFLLRDGREITCEPVPGGNARDLPLYVLGPALGILLHQRGLIVLHASAVEIGGKAVLFCGQSGAGKSTMAAALVKRGFRLVSEDICAITVSDSKTPVVQPDGKQLKLWAQSIDNLDFAEDRGERVQRHEPKFYVALDEFTQKSLPLGAIYALRKAVPPYAPGIEPLSVVDLAVILRRNAFRPSIVDRLEQRGIYLAATSVVANSAGNFWLTRPFDFAAIPQVVGWLESHWQDIGLMERAA